MVTLSFFVPEMLFLCNILMLIHHFIFPRWKLPFYNHLSPVVSSRSTLHRVLGNGQDRYSIAYFVEPNHDSLVECLPTCKTEKSPPKFPPIRCSTYLSQRYKETHADLSVYDKHEA
ncbi:hypothetical protein Goari_027393 [Gossypium aridum]|uniref:Uncharacterized protein n=1 Tax=Gossypium aridum TaxID=34290 RepID=A0A7J8YUY0_GOSAI|nr:hypothetical protein [Gossypium aridum]